MANMGIMHWAPKPGGFPMCRKRNAIMSTTAERFILEVLPCKRCLALYNKFQAKKKVAP